jgi:hypothetical protein
MIAPAGAFDKVNCAPRKMLNLIPESYRFCSKSSNLAQKTGVAGS